MNSIKIIKRGKDEVLTEQQGQDEMTGKQSTREMVRTVKGWIAELHRRRQIERTNAVFGKVRVTLSLIILSFWGLGTESDAQQLRDAFRRVEQAVVIVRTEQKGLAPFPQQGMVSLNGLGSGVLISNDGKVLTAAHLVQSADRTVVEFSRGELIPARVMGSAFSADVALLQLERNPVNVVAAALGDSDKLDVGDQIFVVGAPYGLSRTLTAGHVSGRHALNKRSENTTAVEFLQTDAAVNSGNSGSSVFSLDGEVMGIVSNIMSRSGGSEGLAFAATSNTARRLLIEQKPFWSGIEGLLVDSDLARALNLPQPAGVLVQRVAEGSIAWRWGIHAGTLRANVEGEEFILGGDIILRVNEVPVDQSGSYDEISASIGRLKPGDNLVISVFRQGQIVKLSIPAT
ncbi:MAG: trypsin-like peptidase domain-containing protein, partial [Pyrinomonadaceae bacterium]|nr:trypsin-like peptidase domain-containing protein [Pyrinomonadaceae bacterium]